MIKSDAFCRLHEDSLDAALEVSLDGSVIAANPAACDLFRRTESEICDTGYLGLLDTASLQSSDFFEADKYIGGVRCERVFVRGDGTRFWGEVTSVRYANEHQEPRVALVLRDLTKRKQVEKEREELRIQLQQLRKMDSIGLLAGQVAHDFNNMLAVIVACGQLALKHTPPGQQVAKQLQEILNAADRSTDLTRQLLAVARHQTPASEVFALNDVVGKILKMLQRMLGEDVELVWQPGSDVWPIKMVPSQIDQIMMNLCINARDAMEGAGKITIATHHETFDVTYCNSHPRVVPGDYVRLSVSDDGCGMDENTLNRVFEPFFTTKNLNMGTGIGLSTVIGIVEQNKGFVDVRSAPGQGTTFNIYLPRCRQVSTQTGKEEHEGLSSRERNSTLSL